ncbi:MAG: triose-phosphate isomerase [Alphaproteobacteria bacterium]|nr:triose-phosphate isomerase [Alphaproteobacteria bacterium]MCD8520382.1 triose-phosphate isomerase [Alphaproteobacteria bacterium]MCD8570069.1 triose-phosphate isomerase [Alphaproteobacteria bacterium]
MKKLIAGNWKMNCSLEEAKLLIADVINGVYQNQALQGDNEFVIFPPFIYLPTVRHALGNHTFISFGAQDCSPHDKGAYTGDISASMLKDSACTYAIAGHSERRKYHCESNADIKAKAEQVIKNGMTAIVCIGETQEERDGGRAEEVVQKQLFESLPAGAHARNTVIAYEPVWAIGTGKTASETDILMMHSFIREALEEKLADAENMRILYGGSVNPENGPGILKTPNVDGVLVGGASLKAQDFLAIAG